MPPRYPPPDLSRPRHASRPLRRPALISGVVSAVLLALAAGWFFLLRESGNQPIAVGPFISGGREPVPHFAFKLAGVRAIPTGTHKKAHERAKKAASNIQTTLDRLYKTGFVDPNAWQDARYGGIWQLFDPTTLPEARDDLATLTLGDNAGAVYETVRPVLGRLKIRILLDRGGHPSTAVASVAFGARGEEMQGGQAVIHSTGQFFLRPRHGAWSIYGYDLEREDQPVAAHLPGSPSP